MSPVGRLYNCRHMLSIVFVQRLSLGCFNVRLCVCMYVCVSLHLSFSFISDVFAFICEKEFIINGGINYLLERF